MNHFILSDSRKCIGCRACEVACVMAHNEEQHVLTPQRFLPRITVIKAEGQRNAITCRHCEDAPCVRSCPNDAIAQSGDSVQVRQEKCIGCKSCMVACPFGVMQVVVTPQAAGLVKASAHKCDLCQGREAGPACVENCPAQALTLADDETLITWRSSGDCARHAGGAAVAARYAALQPAQCWREGQANGDDAPARGAG